VFAENQLFATLDPTLRGTELPSGRRVILSDTVGFISELPTELVAAFRATLEEVAEADVILHVRDAAHPDSQAQRADVASVLDGMAEDGTLAPDWSARTVEVLNKADLLGGVAAGLRPSRRRGRFGLTGEGLPSLREVIDARISEGLQTVGYDVPASDGAQLAWLYEHGEVVGRQDGDEAIHVTVRLSSRGPRPLRAAGLPPGRGRTTAPPAAAGDVPAGRPPLRRRPGPSGRGRSGRIRFWRTRRSAATVAAAAAQSRVAPPPGAPFRARLPAGAAPPRRPRRSSASAPPRAWPGSARRAGAPPPARPRPPGSVQPASVTAVPRMRASRAAATASAEASRPNSRSTASPARSISASTRASSAAMPPISAGGSGSSPERIAISPMAATRVWIGPPSPPRDAKAPKATARAASPSTSRASSSMAAIAGDGVGGGARGVRGGVRARHGGHAAVGEGAGDGGEGVEEALFGYGGHGLPRVRGRIAPGPEAVPRA
jgi:hypothetical protein